MKKRLSKLWTPLLFLGIMAVLLLGHFTQDVRSSENILFKIQSEAGQLQVSLSGIDPLANDFHYEGWLIVNGAPVTTGKFNVDGNGMLVDLDGNVLVDSTFLVSADVSAATAVVITIEPAGDTDEIPAATKYLGGEIDDGSATLSPAFAAALGSDFLDATGKYILATPTNGTDTNENSGIWFLELVSNTLVLDFTGLDSLASGFHYEGWAIIDGMPYTTGKFNINGSGMLVDLAGNEIPNGEFVTELDLSMASDVVITIEPDGDTDTMPADTKIFGGPVVEGISELTTEHPATLNNNFDAATGTYILATPTNGADTNENSGIWFLDLSQTTLAISVENFAPLANGFHYEGWAIVDGAPVSTGKFNLNESGEIVDLQNNVIANGYFTVPSNITTASDIVITIEPDGDTDTIPADTKIVGGGVTDGSASLNTSHSATLANDYTAATGKYILATPTNGADTNENSGIWFLDLSSGSPAVGLDLPVLPAGWKYEGWTVIDGIPVTSGTFTDVADFDDADPFSSTMPGPPFPGEDYLNNAPDGLTFPTDIAGGTAVISIEPSPDDSEAPFLLKPLVGQIPSDAVDHTVYEMGNNAASFPTATATIMHPVAGLTLPDLPAGWAYEGWTVIDGIPVTTGKFTAVNDFDWSDPFSSTMPGPPFPGEDFLENAPDGLTFPTDISGGTAVISIEPMPDDSPAPFTLKPLVGAIPADAVDHTQYAMMNNAAAFASGTAHITAKPAAGLSLNTLPDGWVYEGWVVIDGTAVTTGKFTAINEVDWSDPYSSTMPGPPFPGEDFLENAPDGLTFPTDIAGGTAVISIEPMPDDSPAPFTLKPLVGGIPADATDHTAYEMGNNAASFPSGWAQVQDVTSVQEDGFVPERFALLQNYPNPFNPTTVIRFNTAEKNAVRLEVYNIVGQKVATLVDEELSAGAHSVVFEAANLPAGFYMYKLQTGGKTEVRKMTFLK